MGDRFKGPIRVDGWDGELDHEGIFGHLIWELCRRYDPHPLPHEVVDAFAAWSGQRAGDIALSSNLTMQAQKGIYC